MPPSRPPLAYRVTTIYLSLPLHVLNIQSMKLLLIFSRLFFRATGALSPPKRKPWAVAASEYRAAPPVYVFMRLCVVTCSCVCVL